MCSMKGVSILSLIFVLCRFYVVITLSVGTFVNIENEHDKVFYSVDGEVSYILKGGTLQKENADDQCEVLVKVRI